MCEAHTGPAEFQCSLEDIVIEACAIEQLSGHIAGVHLLRVEPDLLAAIRALAAMGPAERLMIMSYAKGSADLDRVIGSLTSQSMGHVH
jgi:hypothetical protein